MVLGFQSDVIVVFLSHIIIQILGNFRTIINLVVIHVVLHKTVGGELDEQRTHIFRRMPDGLSHLLKTQRLEVIALEKLPNGEERIFTIYALQLSHSRIVKEILRLESGHTLTVHTRQWLQLYLVGRDIP